MFVFTPAGHTLVRGACKPPTAENRAPLAGVSKVRRVARLDTGKCLIHAEFRGRFSRPPNAVPSMIDASAGVAEPGRTGHHGTSIGSRAHPPGRARGGHASQIRTRQPRD